MSYRLNWEKLLSSRRPQSSDSQRRATATQSSVDDPDIRTEFEKDYDRIVFSAPFRRLARKTQVHPLAKNDHIHNRLTHSIEVASVGRSLAARLAVRLQSSDTISGDQAQNLIWAVRAACLVHDLGNPPFGHAAEEAVRQWTRDHYSEIFEWNPGEGVRPLFETEAERQGTIADWLNAEGNANGFRFASRKDVQLVSYLNLTHATLAAAVKYPWTSSDPRAAKKGKHNVYSTEREIFLEMAEDLGLRGNDGSVCRHPLSFLTEAADDICYRILDLEDAVELKIESHDNIRQLLCEITGVELQVNTNLHYLRAVAIGKLTSKLWQVFESDFENIMNGQREADLKSSLDSQTNDQLARIKEIYTNIFSDPKKMALEIGCYHILGRILDELLKTVKAIHLAPSFEELPFLSRRCAELAWTREYTKQHFDKSYAWWLSQMLDFVNGMTDDYAASISSQISGHSRFDW